MRPAGKSPPYSSHTLSRPLLQTPRLTYAIAMDAINAIILGIIEGLTEFLPVSSTGHMVIAMPLLGVDAAAAPWSILLWVSQFAAILGVIVLFWRDLWRRVFKPTAGAWHKHLLVILFVAMVPTVGLAVPFKEYFDPLEQNPPAVARGR